MLSRSRVPAIIKPRPIDNSWFMCRVRRIDTARRNSTMQGSSFEEAPPSEPRMKMAAGAPLHASRDAHTVSRGLSGAVPSWLKHLESRALSCSE